MGSMRAGYTYKYRLTEDQAHQLVNQAAAVGVDRYKVSGIIESAARSGKVFSIMGTDASAELKFTYWFKELPITITLCTLNAFATRAWMEGKQLEALG
jgi:hypothetical protein